MVRRFAKVSEEEIEEAFFYASDLVNNKTTIPLRVGEERWIYTSTLRVSVYIHQYSSPLLKLSNERVMAIFRPTNKMTRFVESYPRERAAKKYPLTSQLLNYNARDIFLPRTCDN